MRLLTLIPTLLATTTSAWSVAFYNDNTCNHEANYFTYSGTGQGDCLLVGTDADQCAYFWIGGTVQLPCEGQRRILAQLFGMSFPKGTECFMGYDERCSMNALYSDLQCAMAPDGQPEGEEGTKIYFQCWDVDGGEGGSG